jgi:hypothetical protein
MLPAGLSDGMVKMNWETIATLAEVVAAIGVIASLIYVARQVRSSQETAADTNRLTRASGVREIMLANATNDELRNSVIKAFGLTKNYEKMARVLEIDFDDAARVDFQNNMYFWLHWGQFSSTTDPQDLEELKGVVLSYSIPAFKYSWENSLWAPRPLDSKFVEFVDTALAGVSDDHYKKVVSQRD